jgi:hypothetical protein
MKNPNLIPTITINKKTPLITWVMVLCLGLFLIEALFADYNGKLPLIGLFLSGLIIILTVGVGMSSALIHIINKKYTKGDRLLAIVIFIIYILLFFPIFDYI